MILHDAHNHLQHERLAPFLEEALTALQAMPFGRAVVNGTRESDWPTVSELSGRLAWAIPSYGVHPWYAANVSETCSDDLEARLKNSPGAAVGEIGLDRWIEGHDLAVQTPVFQRQMQLATQYDRPATIHCVRAWGALWEQIRKMDLPTRGFLLHAYGGPAEMVDGFADHGAYFSFSPYFLHERKAPQRAVFARLPLDRILVETDAPDMAPPPQLSNCPRYDAEGNVVNHPANIVLAYEALAEIRGMELAELADAVAENFGRLFGPAVRTRAAS